MYRVEEGRTNERERRLRSVASGWRYGRRLVILVGDVNLKCRKALYRLGK